MTGSEERERAEPKNRLGGGGGVGVWEGEVSLAILMLICKQEVCVVLHRNNDSLATHVPCHF